MPRTNQDGKDIRLVLEWLCRRRLSEAELATALDIPPANYNRRKDADDFPSFEELAKFADHYDLCQRALQIAFGYLDRDALQLLDEDGLRQYVEQGGGEVPFFSSRGRRATTKVARCEPKAAPPQRRRRQLGAPPG